MSGVDGGCRGMSGVDGGCRWMSVDVGGCQEMSGDVGCCRRMSGDVKGCQGIHYEVVQQCSQSLNLRFSFSWIYATISTFVLVSRLRSE